MLYGAPVLYGAPDNGDLVFQVSNERISVWIATIDLGTSFVDMEVHADSEIGYIGLDAGEIALMQSLS